MIVSDGGDVIAGILVRQGVRFVFTLCGGHISPILVGRSAAALPSSTSGTRPMPCSPPTRSRGSAVFPASPS